jgi:hypothetical protein
VYHHVVRQQYLGPLNEFGEGRIESFNFDKLKPLMFKPSKYSAENLFTYCLSIIFLNHLLNSQCRVILQVLIQWFLICQPNSTIGTLYPHRLYPHNFTKGRETSVEPILCIFFRHWSFQKITKISDICPCWAFKFQFIVNLSEVKVS